MEHLDEGIVQRKMLRFEFLSNEGYPDYLSPWADHNITSVKPIFQKGLRKAMTSGPVTVMILKWDICFWPSAKEKIAFLRAVIGDIKADSVLMERAITSLVDGLYKAALPN